jgi:hypothetical protein
VLRFLRKTLSLPLPAADLNAFVKFERENLAPSYVMKTVLKLSVEIDTLADQNRDLSGQIASLTATITRLQQQRTCASTTVLPFPGDSDSARASRKLGVVKRKAPSLSSPGVFAFFNLDVESSFILEEEKPPSSRLELSGHSSRAGFPALASNINVDTPLMPHDNGICARLGEDLNGNPAEMGILIIRGNSCDAARDQVLPNLVDYTWEKCWISRNEPQSWVSFDFGTTPVLIARYSIKTYRMPKGFSHLKSWVLQASYNNGATWEELDRREGLSDLNGKGLSAMFVVQKPKNAQLVRILQIGPNHAGDHYLILTNVEFYGDIISEE